MEELDFLNTVDVDTFKAAQGVSELDIVRSKKTGKCFFSYGTETGAVTSKFPAEPLHTPMVSQVQSHVTGKIFYLLHNRGEGAIKMMTL
jgi:hypothetical protein